MGIVASYRPHTRQPRELTGVSSKWRHLATINVGAGFRNLALNGAAITVSAGMTIKSGPGGVGSNQNGSSGNTVSAPITGMTSADPITLVAVFSGRSNGGTLAPFIAAQQSGGWQVPGIVTVSGAPGLYFRGSSGTQIQATVSDLTVNDNDVVSVAGCWVPGEGIRVAANNSSVATASLADTTSYGAPTSLHFGGAAALVVYLAAALKGYRSHQELQQLAQNPWQILEEELQLIYVADSTSTAPGTTFTETFEIIAGSASGQIAATAPGTTFTMDLAEIAGSASGAIVGNASGTTFTETFEIIAGAASASGAGTAAGFTFTETFALTAGSAVGNQVGNAAGTMLTMTMALTPGTANGGGGGSGTSYPPVAFYLGGGMAIGTHGEPIVVLF